MLLIVEANPLSHVIVIPPETIGKEARRVTLDVVSQLSFKHADVSVAISPEYLDPDRATLDAACRAATNWTVILDERGLERLPPALRATLLSPHRSKTFGHEVVSLDMDCDQPPLCLLAHHSVPARYPLPPFALSSHHSGLLASVLMTGHHHNVWQAVGALIIQQDQLYRDGFLVWNESRALTYLYDGAAKAHQAPPEAESTRRDDAATFLLVVTSVDDLRAFSPAACGLQRAGHSLHVLVYGGHENSHHHGLDGLRGRVLPISLNCSIVYHEGYLSQGERLAWTLGEVVDVVIHDAGLDTYSASFEQFIRRVVNDNTTHVHIPQADLPFTDWMGSLRKQEWRNWHAARIDLSVVTYNRPRSLHRLLISLQNARYFGDSVSLRINVEEGADLEVHNVIKEFAWTSGPLMINHRVQHGGLLAAVVESWYPDSDHSYGLLLEDDIELSPLFYAWVKMTVLRYRYGGHPAPEELYGISLYQQTNLELPLEGRRKFNAQHLFESEGLPRNAPYLSQIPCSWGAVYFPEHWREFHAYLSARLSTGPDWITADADIVPDVRSTRWTRSWKKYFIELVYMRGYVMLYPNYNDFVSLSTNHLEPGSHVKVGMTAEYLKKKALFEVPLMAPAVPSPDGLRPVGLLDMPGTSLPDFDSLPVLDLLGRLTSIQSVHLVGASRREEVFCASPYSVPHALHSLFCV
ncbi:hypothetical protein PUNSTDRAFT_136755 [Punctularia strigosozonata HHB-11173 SS5]|uniref:uncharacterized protein n=1 Tax=Punctularia strigosozonata (strain HHB-11173) TaxID=741275 RepID=UPI0004416751|nr:uncharacterized protein PUNSTDRAFT_136755 [Punctularia strigosozonata HHB-11173 SS5]EIN05955.1 hypothetical protein PUNSTDRAFT_136755 [Punctularia strigosozonata HHB-11173 SS5]